MKTINRSTAHKQLTTKHNTMLYETRRGRLSVRKQSGRYIVRLEDYELSKVVKSSYATLPGAMIAADNLKEYYL